MTGARILTDERVLELALTGAPPVRAVEDDGTLTTIVPTLARLTLEAGRVVELALAGPPPAGSPWRWSPVLRFGAGAVNLLDDAPAWVLQLVPGAVG